MPAHIANIRQFIAAVERKTVELEQVARRTSTAAALALERETKKSLAATSHKKGTPTPSAPGSPPAKVSGGLGRSVVSTPGVLIGPSTWRARAGIASGSEAADYASIQEHGGSAGRNHTANLPARPYLSSSHRHLLDSGVYAALYTLAFREAISR